MDEQKKCSSTYLKRRICMWFWKLETILELFEPLSCMRRASVKMNYVFAPSALCLLLNAPH